jgi:flagellar protein FlbD
VRRVIRVTRFDGSAFFLNSDLIQTVESNPDTHIVLTTGTSYLVREPDVEVVGRIVEFRRAITGPDGGRRGLRVVSRRAEARP